MLLNYHSACFYTDEPSTGSHQSFCATCSSESTIFPYSGKTVICNQIVYTVCCSNKFFTIPFLWTDDPYRPSHSSTLADWTALYVDLCHFLQFLLFPTWWLNGTIINAAQILLKEQAAERFVGFQNVALNERLQFKLVEKDRPFVQILHVDGKHWVAATNAGCSKGEVKIFDSAYSHLTLDTKKQICSFLRPQENRIKFVIANMQCQDGPGSCGLYAIAVCAALVAGKDPTTLEWEESSMRRHLYMCILQNRLTPFPLKRHPGSSSTIKEVVIEEEICCKCRMPAES